MLNEELGTAIDPEYVENPIPPEVNVHDTCADASNLVVATGWEPKIHYETGIERVCEPSVTVANSLSSGSSLTRRSPRSRDGRRLSDRIANPSTLA